MPLSGSWFGRRWDFTRAILENVERNDNCVARKTRLKGGKLDVTHYLQRLVIARDWEPKHQTRPKATASWTNEHLKLSLRKHSARAQRPNEQKKSLPIRIYFVFLKFLKFLKNTYRKATNADTNKMEFPVFSQYLSSPIFLFRCWDSTSDDLIQSENNVLLLVGCDMLMNDI